MAEGGLSPTVGASVSRRTVPSREGVGEGSTLPAAPRVPLPVANQGRGKPRPYNGVPAAGVVGAAVWRRKAATTPTLDAAAARPGGFSGADAAPQPLFPAAPAARGKARALPRRRQLRGPAAARAVGPRSGMCRSRSSTADPDRPRLHLLPAHRTDRPRAAVPRRFSRPGAHRHGFSRTLLRRRRPRLGRARGLRAGARPICGDGRVPSPLSPRPPGHERETESINSLPAPSGRESPRFDLWPSPFGRGCPSADGG